MNILSKALIGVLGLTALIPLKLALLCLFSRPDAFEFFSIQLNTPDIDKLLIVLGCFVLATAVIQILAMVWIIKGNAEGYSLSLFVGFINMGRGALMLSLLGTDNSNNIRISVSPIVIGIVIIVLAIIAKKKKQIVV